MIASLPMYDRPETAAANDRLWSLIHQALGDYGIAAPDTLTRGADLWQTWMRPDLCLSQTCGLPYRTALHGHVTLVATPSYDLPCDPGHYFSVMVAHRSDTRERFDGATLAYNDGRSQSGWAAAVDWATQTDTSFGHILATGGHLNSARAVAEGRADIAAIDALTWKMIKRWEGCAQTMREVATTTATPTLPMITAKNNDAHVYWMALNDAAGALSDADRADLGLRAYVQIPSESYLEIPTPQSPGE